MQDNWNYSKHAIERMEARVSESDEQKSGIIFDYDVEGNIVGIEILEASKKTKNPAELTREID